MNKVKRPNLYKHYVKNYKRRSFCISAAVMSPLVIGPHVKYYWDEILNRRQEIERNIRLEIIDIGKKKGGALEDLVKLTPEAKL